MGAVWSPKPFVRTPFHALVLAITLSGQFYTYQVFVLAKSNCRPLLLASTIRKKRSFYLRQLTKFSWADSNSVFTLETIIILVKRISWEVINGRKKSFLFSSFRKFTLSIFLSRLPRESWVYTFSLSAKISITLTEIEKEKGSIYGKAISVTKVQEMLIEPRFW